MVNEPMMVAAKQLHDEARKWSSKVSQHFKSSGSPLKNVLFHIHYVSFIPCREMTSSVRPNEWPCSWLRCHVWCVAAAETSVPSFSVPRTSPRLLMKSLGWPRRWPSSVPTSVSGPTSSRSLQSSLSDGFIMERLLFVVFNPTL